MKKMIISILLCCLFTWAALVIGLFVAADVIAKEWILCVIPLVLAALVTSCLFEEGRKEFLAGRRHA